MDSSCKGIWGYAPLIVSLANTRRPVARAHGAEVVVRSNTSGLL